MNYFTSGGEFARRARPWRSVRARHDRGRAQVAPEQLGRLGARRRVRVDPTPHPAWPIGSGGITRGGVIEG
jgi:hypothetical protein